MLLFLYCPSVGLLVQSVLFVIVLFIGLTLQFVLGKEPVYVFVTSRLDTLTSEPFGRESQRSYLLLI